MTESRPPTDVQRPAAPAAGLARVWVVALAASLIGLAVTLLQAAHGSIPLRAVPWLMVTVAIAVTESFPVHFEGRRETLSISLSTIPLVVALFILPPVGVVIARLAGSVFVLLFRRRQNVLKVCVNLAGFWVESAVAVTIFGLAATRDGGDLHAWVAALAAALAGDTALTVVLVSAISLYQGRWEQGMTTSALVGSAAVVVDTCIALMAVTLLRAQPAALIPMAVVSVMLLASYRAHRGFREKHRQLEDLYDFTSRVGTAVLHGAVGTTLLDEARELMKAERAWLCVESDGGLVRIDGGEDHDDDDDGGGGGDGGDGARNGETAIPSRPATPQDLRLHELAHDSGRAQLVAPGRGAPVDTATLVAPLAGADGPIGTLVVAERSGSVRPFGRGDLHLFVTIANHVGVALENARLVDRLREQAEISRHRSLHDGLTGLPNRALFAQRLDACLAAGTPVGVLLLDLDRFKEVNDTLGHHNGDKLLKQVGERLHSAVRDGDTVARFGGDEFAVLLPGVVNATAAVHVANGIAAVLEQPFGVADVSVDVGTSIGIVLAPEHGGDEATLLQRADVAMYAAKDDQSTVALYQHDRDESSPERLRLVTDLRRAIHEHELQVHYQPQIDLPWGTPIAVEALVRWTHPTRGPVPPDEFVPIAEHTGLIRPLTLFVLERAIADCAHWRREGWELRVSVNLSARSLLQPTIVDDVTGLLERHQLPARALCLELTESAIVSDFKRTVGILERLRQLGITIAIDDFGTGHSSLAYLQRLPIGEIKIDKSFVLHMHERAGDRAIVRSVVDLARNLDLPVVAEGIETEEAADQLREMGCRFGQGYLFSRPVPAPALLEWLRQRRDAQVGAAPLSGAPLTP